MPKADHMATDGRFAPLRLSTLIHAKWETNNDGGDMPKSRTLMGIEYEYSGSLNTGLIVHKKVDIHISANAIRLIIAEITDKSPILMGACRDNPIKGSIGAMLRKNGYSPQYSSYVIPLLIEEGFCKASENRPYKIMKQKKDKM